MKTNLSKDQDNQNKLLNSHNQVKQKNSFTAQFVNGLPETVAVGGEQQAAINSSPKVQQLKRMQEALNSSPNAAKAKAMHAAVNSSPRVQQLKAMQAAVNSSPQVLQLKRMQAMVNGRPIPADPIQKKPNNTGLPDHLKSGIEDLSGYTMDDVKVHYNSGKPAQLQAHAYAQGTDIHLAPGQEQHLPHEAWHVVQQKQGRVRPTMQMKGKVNINDDDGLEREADLMGGKLKNGVISPPLSTEKAKLDAPIQQKVAQRQKVPTNFGEFETVKFVGAEDRGVEITLKFHPDESKVDAKKIALTQSVKKTDSSGGAYGIDPNQSSKVVGSGKSGAGYAIDRVSNKNNPIYGGRILGESEGLEDTPTARKTPANLGVNTNYELGHCYKKNPEDEKKAKHSAGLWDKPRSGKNKGESKIFETTALAIEGTDKDKYYGSVKWGFKMEGTTASPTLTKFDITEVSKGDPSANFIEAAKLWNAGKARGTLKVSADPEATVVRVDTSASEKLAKGKKLKQLKTVMWGANPAIQAEVLNDDGTGTSKTIYIKNSDVVDIGDGKDTVNLPIPATE